MMLVKPFVLLGLGLAAIQALSQPTHATLRVGDPPPPIVVGRWVKGDPVKEIEKGKVTIIDFWATWCDPCIRSFPHLSALAKKYPGKLTIIGVDSFEREKIADKYYPMVTKFVVEQGDRMSYSVAIDGQAGTMRNTWMDAASQTSIPTAFVIDRSGKIAWIGNPLGRLDEVVDKIISGTFDPSLEAGRPKTVTEHFDEMSAAIHKAEAAKRYPEAVAAIDKLLSERGGDNFLPYERLSDLAHYDQAGARKYVSQLVETIFKDNPLELSNLAWMLLEEKGPIRNPDLTQILRMAEHAVKVSSDYPSIMGSLAANVVDTLALAYFRAGRLTDAVDTQKKAIKMASAERTYEPSMLTEMKCRLEKFEKAIKK